MRTVYLIVPLVLLLAACDRPKPPEQAGSLAPPPPTDSLRTDSLVAIKSELLNEVLASTQFVTELNTEIGKLKSHKPPKLSTARARESDLSLVKEQRAAIVASIRELVARLDSSETRLVSLRARAAAFAERDSTIVGQVAAYKKTIAELRRNLVRQKEEYQATIAQQNTQIVALASKVDTVIQENVKLTGERSALTDTVSRLTTEKNTAYFVIGTKDELVKEGILVEEGRRRFVLIGGRPVAPARELDPAKFTRIDRIRDRVINFPDGDFMIFTRQNPMFASPFSAKDGKFSGGLRIDQPDRFWEPSKFLIIVKA